MKTLVPLLLVAVSLGLTGCETTVVDHRPGVRTGYARSDHYYQRSGGYHRVTGPGYSQVDYARSRNSYPRYSENRVENETRINRTVNRTNINRTVVNNTAIERRRASAQTPRVSNAGYYVPAKKQKAKKEKRRNDA